MFSKSKIAFLFSLFILTGFSSVKPIATDENLPPTTIPTMPDLTSTPEPLCIDEPDKKPNNFASIELSNSPLKLETGIDWITPRINGVLDFNIRGIYSINKDIAFIFGGLRTSVGTIRSLLLRSDDGGKHWKEVMPVIDVNDITHIVFIGKGEGWFVATWELEGELGTRLFHSTDFGETWQENKKHPPVDSIIGIRIFDKKHFQIKSLYWWASPTDRYQIWDSYDSGTNWIESYSVPVTGKNLNAVVVAYADMPGGNYGNNYQCDMWENACNAFGQDGSKWQVQYVTSKKCFSATDSDPIDRKQFAEVRNSWMGEETKFSIPIYFFYDGNTVRIKP